MTRIERKLRDAGINVTNIKILSPTEFEINVPSDEPGFADSEKSELLMDRCSEVVGWGGYKTGYDSWVLSKHHVSDDYDYSCVSSRHHY